VFTADSLYESLGFETAVVAIRDSAGKAYKRSRYDRFGEVINGPANKGLEPTDVS